METTTVLAAAVTPAEWTVLAFGIAAIVWVNWYFFFAKKGSFSAIGASVEGGVQVVTVTVQGGYEPSVLHVRSGTPVRLVFDRQEKSGCSEEVVLPDFDVRKFLPAFQKTTVEVMPNKPGTYEFTCGMAMLRGQLVVD